MEDDMLKVSGGTTDVCDAVVVGGCCWMDYFWMLLLYRAIFPSMSKCDGRINRWINSWMDGWIDR